MARRAPTIICLEDLHWADPSSLELIRFLLTDFRYPALVICVYRPTLTLFSHQQTATLGDAFIDIRLEDLSPAETEAMVGSLLKTDSLPLELKRFVREKAGGNPFYLEEIMNSLVESQALVPEKDRWVLRKTIEESEISSTIHGVIAARIDRLEAEMKCILQEAAVIGRSFYQEILSHITAFKDNLWHHLSSLETLDIIKARSYRPAVEYIFKHALTQEVVYGGLVKGKRREIHEWVGCVIERLYEDRLSEYYEALAFGLLLNGRVADARHTIAEVEAFCEEFGVEFAGQPTRFFQGVVLVGEGRVDKGLAILEKSCGQWQENGSRLRFAACGSMLAAVYSDLTRKARAGRHKELARQADRRATSYFERSIASARQIGAKGTLAQAYRNWGNYYRDKGEIDKAKECFSEAVGYLRLCGSDILLQQVETEQGALADGDVTDGGDR